LVLVVVGGAELFTGNNLLVMAWVSRRVTTSRVLRNWGLVYAGNFVGAAGTALLALLAGHFGSAGGGVGAAALEIASGKLGRPFVEQVALGALCNALVCLAVWLSYSARSTGDRVVAVVPPVTAFVAAGFEHSVANMYFFSAALLIKWAAPESFWTRIGRRPEDFPALTGSAFLLDNLLPVTLGNLVGGVVLVGLMYWFIYRRRPA
jgi:formate/nitrite transporter